MQSLPNIQRTKNSVYEWYQLLVRMFTELEWKPNSTCGGVWVYIKDGVTVYMNLATDDMLYMSISKGPLNQVLNRFGDFFSFKIKRGTALQFLNFKIIQSEHGILN